MEIEPEVLPAAPVLTVENEVDSLRIVDTSRTTVFYNNNINRVVLCDAREESFQCSSCGERRTQRSDSSNNQCDVQASDNSNRMSRTYRAAKYRTLLGLRRGSTEVTCLWTRLLSLLLILLLAIASVQCAPTMTLDGKRMSTTPKWLNPCGFAAEEIEGDNDMIQLNDALLLGNIVMQAKNALHYSQSFRDPYIKKTFNTDLKDMELTWKESRYNWLPSWKQIPKRLGEQLEQEYLDKMEVRMLDTALLDVYGYMQTFAVGLEQIAWDQDDLQLEFRQKFKDIEYNLRSVLCELQMALAERQVPLRPDVTRDVMTTAFRTLSGDTFRNLRDWIIFRDYMNGLEYMIQVFEHMIHTIQS